MLLSALRQTNLQPKEAASALALALAKLCVFFAVDHEEMSTLAVVAHREVTTAPQANMPCPRRWTS